MGPCNSHGRRGTATAQKWYPTTSGSSDGWEKEFSRFDTLADMVRRVFVYGDIRKKLNLQPISSDLLDHLIYLDWHLAI